MSELRSNEEIEQDVQTRDRSDDAVLWASAEMRLLDDVRPLLVEVTRLRTELAASRDETDSAYREANAMRKLMADAKKRAAAARAEVSPLRAKIERAEMSARPWLGGGDPSNEYELGGRRAALCITAALTEETT